MNELLNDNSIKLKYPNIKDSNLQKKISLKKEFQHKYKSETKDIVQLDKENNLCNYQNFTLSSHQKFVKNFMSPNTPYNGLILYHGMGSGKTCSAIRITEEFRKYNKYNINFKKIMIIASPNVQDNFKLQLFDESKLKKVNNLWKLDGCMGLEFIEELNNYDVENMSKDEIIKKIKKIINSSYVFMGYEKMSNIIEKELNKIKTNDKEKRKKIVKKQLNKLFSDTLIVVDEAHNIRLSSINSKKKTATMLEILVSNVKKMKLLLLTGTPMYNDSTEIVFLLNLLNMNDNQKKININKIFDKSGNFLKEDDDEIGKKRLIQKANGYISYVRGENPYNFPFRIYPNYYNSANSIKNYKYPKTMYNGNKIESPLQFLDLYMNNLSEVQKEGYLYSLKNINEKSIKNDNFSYGYRELQESLFSLTITYPSEDGKYITGKEILSSLMKKTLNHKYSYNDENNRIFEYENIGTYSCKIKSIIDNIINSEGIVLVYSQYLDNGLIPLALALEELGFSRINSKNNLLKSKKSINPYNILSKNNNGSFKQGKYSMITGNQIISSNISNDLKVINSDNNINGLNCKVVLISQAGSEGIDFKNLRQVHILEPWYNLFRIEQIVGRAIRNCSHKKLELKDRNTQIFMHSSYIDDSIETIDMMLYRMCEEKAKKIGMVQKVLKSVSVDCIINYDQLKFSELDQNIPITLSTSEKIEYNIKDKPFSLVCDYSDDCEYKCINELLNNDNIDDSTYTYESTIDKNIIKNIKELFLKKHVYKKNDIVEYINNINTETNLDIIYSSLSYLIDNKNEYIVDKYLRKGNLINIKDLYIFKPVELKTVTSVYDIITPFKSNIKELKIDLDNSIENKSDQPLTSKSNKSKSKSKSNSKTENKTNQKYNSILKNIKLNYKKGLNNYFDTTSKNFYYLYSITFDKLSKDFSDMELNEDFKSTILIEHILECLDHNKEITLLNYLFDKNTDLTNDFVSKIKNYYLSNYIYDLDKGEKLLFLVDLAEKKSNNKYSHLFNNKLKIYIMNQEENKWSELKKSEFMNIGIKKIFDLLQIKNSSNLNNYITFMDFYDKNKSYELKVKNTTEISKKNKGRFIINEYPKKILPLINDSLLEDKSINIIQYRKEQLCIIVEILSKYNNLNSDKKYYLNKLNNKDNYFIKN